MKIENVSRGWPWRLGWAVAYAALFGLLISHGDVDAADLLAFPLLVLVAYLAWPAIAMGQAFAPARMATPGGAAIAVLLAVAYAALPVVQGAPWDPGAALARFAAALGWIVAFAALVVLAGVTARKSGATFD